VKARISSSSSLSVSASSVLFLSYRGLLRLVQVTSLGSAFAFISRSLAWISSLLKCRPTLSFLLLCGLGVRK
jgi:hypothetical protein